MKTFFLSAVIKWFVALPWADFLRVVAQVPAIAAQFPKTASMFYGEREDMNTARAVALKGWISRAFPKLSGWKLNLVLELAVAYFSKKSA